MEHALAEIHQRSRYPWDMGFFPASPALSEGMPLKTPWLGQYWSYRTAHGLAGRDELYGVLHRLNAPSGTVVDGCRGALLGLAIGDALGTTLEFRARDSLTVNDIVGGGPFNLKPGFWTDDTSMACCLAYSLIKSKGFSAANQMECYAYWYQYGAYSPTGRCFDIGVTVKAALDKYLQTGEAYAGSADPETAGNGSLMRLAPVVLFYHPDFEKTVRYAGESSRTTHQATEAVDACRYFAALLYGALNGVEKNLLLGGLYSPVEGYWERHRLHPSIVKIVEGSYKGKSRDEINSSGYVVHTLEAALWAFYRSEDFRSGALAAVNLAGDADTVGAVYGQLAGAYYGETGIPIDWITKTYAAHGFYHFVEDFQSMRCTD
jgi:ADP-ribosylglycohydrolase